MRDHDLEWTRAGQDALHGAVDASGEFPAGFGAGDPVVVIEPVAEPRGMDEALVEPGLGFALGLAIGDFTQVGGDLDGRLDPPRDSLGRLVCPEQVGGIELGGRMLGKQLADAAADAGSLAPPKPGEFAVVPAADETVGVVPRLCVGHDVEISHRSFLRSRRTRIRPMAQRKPGPHLTANAARGAWVRGWFRNGGDKAMSQELLGAGSGRFFRGNLHCHSDRSDGHWSPEAVAAAYREAGYDFIVLSDHFEARYGWQVTDTRHLRDEGFTTILGAELSSAHWEDRHCYWVVAAGLPVDFPAPPTGEHAEAIARAHACGSFVTLLHPGLNNLPLAACDALPVFDAVHAIEISNHAMATGAAADRANGAYLLDGLLEQGHRLLVTAGDDAHFGRPDDRFGSWIEVSCDRLEPDALVTALKTGHYFSTQGPALCELRVEGNRLHVKTSDVHVIGLTGGGDRWLSGTERTSEPGATIAAAEFDLTPFRGAYCRVVAIDGDGKRAWSTPSGRSRRAISRPARSPRLGRLTVRRYDGVRVPPTTIAREPPMDVDRFDHITRLLTSSPSRRATVGTALGTLLGVLHPGPAAAKKRKKCGPCKKRKKGKCKPKPNGTACSSDGKVCQGGRCRCRASCSIDADCCDDQECLSSDSCAKPCTSFADCPFGCACFLGAEQERFCVQDVICPDIPQACAGTSVCPSGQACFITACSPNPNRCIPLC